MYVLNWNTILNLKYFSAFVPSHKDFFGISVYRYRDTIRELWKTWYVVCLWGNWTITPLLKEYYSDKVWDWINCIATSVCKACWEHYVYETLSDDIGWGDYFHDGTEMISVLLAICAKKKLMTPMYRMARPIHSVINFWEKFRGWSLQRLPHVPGWSSQKANRTKCTFVYFIGETNGISATVYKNRWNRYTLLPSCIKSTMVPFTNVD